MFYIDRIEIAGEGALLKLIEERKKRLQKKGYFDENKYKHAADWEFWLRASTKGYYFQHIAKPLSIYRIVKKSHNRRSSEVHTEIPNKIISEYYDTAQKLNGIFDFNTHSYY